MKMQVRKYNPEDEYFFDEGCHIVEVSNSVDDPEVSIARARVEPGVRTQWHFLVKTTERYVILQGSGIVEIGEQAPQAVEIGDVVIIPPGVRQRIYNPGNEDLLFLAICSPRFTEQAYNAM